MCVLCVTFVSSTVNIVTVYTNWYSCQQKNDVWYAMASFPENFADLLAEHGWNQNVAAEKLGVSQANISRWLSGEREPGLTALIQIAHGLGVTVDELLGSSGTTKLKSRMLGSKSGPTERVPPVFKKFKTRFRAVDPVLRDFMVGQIRALFGPEAKQILAWLNTP